MKAKITSMLIAGTALLSLTLPTTHAASTVIWDQSPDGTRGTLTDAFWTNEDVQNFADPVSFDSAVSVTGMDIYMSADFGAVGDSGIFTIRTASHLATPIEVNVTVSVIDTDGTSSIAGLERLHVDFDTPLSLAADEVYWVGMFADFTWTQAGLIGGVGPMLDNQSAVYSFGQFSGFSTDVGDTAFRLWGTPVPVPPAIWLLGSSLVGLFGFSRRRLSA